jgi:glycosyltransferase involved in cell wall biosynthesis
MCNRGARTIVHIGPANLPVTHSRGGAIERRMLELARAQARRGHRVIVYSADAVCQSVWLDGVEIRKWACRHTGSLRTLELASHATGELRSEHVDVLHFHSVPEGALLARGLSAAKYLSYDDFRFRRGRSTPLFWYYQRLLARFDALLPVSEYCRRESLAYWKLRTTPAHVLYNGVNLTQFAPDPDAGRKLRASLRLGEAPVILYVGRTCEQKGTDVLLSAYSALRQNMPSVRLVVAGPAMRFGCSGESELTERIRQEGDMYLGAVEEDRLCALYNLADVFVMPTRRDEMFGMAALEAQACGKPVICSRLGGLVEVISERSGMLFTPADAAALAKCITTLLADKPLYRRLAAASRDNASRFSWDDLAATLETIYSVEAGRTMPAASVPV